MQNEKDRVTWVGVRPSVIDDISKEKIEEEKQKSALDDYYNESEELSEEKTVPLSLAQKAEIQSQGVNIVPRDFTYTHGYTHAGQFHADDVFSTAFLDILSRKFMNTPFTVNRVNEVPENADGIVYDIGRGEFDHHQADNESRENGIPYASLGKLWREFGAHLCGNNYELAEMIDRFYIQHLDNADAAGVFCDLSSIILSMNPSWLDLTGDMEKDRTTENEKFNQAVHIGGIMFENMLDSAIRTYCNQLMAQGRTQDVQALSDNGVDLSDMDISPDFVVMSMSRYLDGDFKVASKLSDITNIDFSPDNIKETLQNASFLQVVANDRLNFEEVMCLALVQRVNPDIKFIFVDDIKNIENEFPAIDFTVPRDLFNDVYDYPTADVRLKNVDYGLFSTLSCILSEPGMPLESERNAITGLVTHMFQGIDYNSIYMDTPPYMLTGALVSDNITESIELCSIVLENELQRNKDLEKANEKVTEMIKCLPDDKKNVLFLDKFVPWKDAAINSNVQFAVFPSRGAWAIAPAVRGTGRGMWRIEFPKRWRGMDAETLSKEIPSMTFCHNDNLLAVVEDFNDVQKVIYITIAEWEKAEREDREGMDESVEDDLDFGDDE